MKLHQLFEAIDPALAALIQKHQLKPNKTGSAVADFNFTKEIGDEFAAAGFTLNYNQKSGMFDVKSSAKLAQQQTDHETANAVKNITGRAQGFVPRRKQK